LKVSGSGLLAVWGNDNQLRQVVRNLLTNAIKYTPDEGRISCEYIMVSSHPQDQTGAISEIWPGCNDLPPGRWAAVRVADTGIGISQVDLPHLFERFYRVKAQGNIRGTGLGLSITRELIELHSGHIVVSSTLDKGSVFAIYLPLLAEE
jgi:signal transduction histidine kinase